MNDIALVWFRLDLRLEDNPALAAALKRGCPVIPLYLWSPEDEKSWNPGAASRWWLHHSLLSLERSLQKRSSRLILRQGAALAGIENFVEEGGVTAVFWNRLYQPALVERDRQIQARLRQKGIDVQTFDGSVLSPPEKIKNQSGQAYQVFTPYWKNCLAQEGADSPPPARLQPQFPVLPRWPRSLALQEIGLIPKIAWDQEIARTWRPGEKRGRALLRRFLKNGFADYTSERNRPDRAGTSGLSPYLHFGEISPHYVMREIRRTAEKKKIPEKVWRQNQFLNEIGWREFSYYLLHHFPRTTDRPLRPEFEKFPWRTDARALKAWQQGKTGYPFVDAGMRQLWAIGWMHNRVRMVVGSFLVKNLLLSWHDGAKWFWDTLVDADLASNTLGWQWVAGCGADAAPYFRIFNPVLQGEKFDPEGNYIRRWVPELKELPAKWIHQPWNAPREMLETAGVILGKTYPEPLIDHAAARILALRAYEEIKT